MTDILLNDGRAVEEFYFPRAIACRHAESMQYIDDNIQQVRQKLASWNLSLRTFDVLEAATTGLPLRGFHPRSNFHIRRASSRAMIEAFMEFARQRAYPDFYSITFCWNDGVTSVCRPELNLRRMYGQVYRALNIRGLNSLFFFETSMFRKLPKEKLPKERYGFFHEHVHAVCWTDGQPFPLKQIEALCSARKFPNFIGAPSVVVKHLDRELSNSHLNATDMFNVAGLVGYPTKVDTKTKRLKPGADHTQGFVMESAEESSAESILRLLEVQSHIDIFDTVHAVGEGKEVKKDWTRKLNAALQLQARRRSTLTRKQVEKAWIDARSNNGPRHYEPCEIIPTNPDRQV